MAADPNIAEFLEKAQNAGIPHESLVGMLTASGWKEKDIYMALSDRYRKLTGLEVPRRAGSGASAKDAFFYLLIFATLATWTLNLGSLAFQLIERWFSDPLFSNSQQTFETYAMTWSLSAILIAFPLYLLISRIVLREAALDPEKLDSGIRKWLTYLALVVAACIFMGDLICALAYLLRGELTSQFLARSFVVLALSGGVFFYYFGGLRRTGTQLDAQHGARAASPRRDRWMALLSASVVALLVVLGFLQLGPPHSQRDLRADAQRVQQLYQLGNQIENYWKSHASQLPPSIDTLPGQHLDPITRAHYEYRPGNGSQYQLCATFTRESPSGENRPDPDAWSHSEGRHCFSLDSSTQLQSPMGYPPY